MATTSKTKKTAPSETPTAENKAGTVAKKRTVKPTDEVKVVSSVYGKLVYVSPRSGYRTEWATFGSFNFMTVDELTTMRATQSGFFENQWIVLAGENAADVMEFLRIEQYYKNISDLNDIDNLFRNTPADLPEVLGHFTPAAKETIARRAHELIEAKTLTDINVIRTLEKELGYNLTT